MEPTDSKQNPLGLANILTKEDLSQVLLTILNFLLGFLSLSAVSYLFTRSASLLPVSVTSLLLVVVSAIAIILVRKKQVGPAVFLMLLACGLILAGVAWNGNGVMGTAFLLNGLLIVGATLYWGHRAGILAILLMSLFGIVILIADRIGWRSNAAPPTEDWFMLVFLIANFSILSLIISIILKYVHQLVGRVRQNETELRSLNTELEKRVHERTAQLEKSEKLLNIISANMQDVIWTMDLQMRTTFVTDSGALLRGFSPEELVDEPLAEALTPDSYALAVQALQEELKNEARAGANPNRSRVLHLDYKRKNGATIRMEVRASFLRDENGQAIGLTEVNRDISERQWMEQALLDSEERYRRITSVISDYSYSAVVTAEGEYRPEWAAGAFAEITGYEFDEYLAAGGWENLLHPDALQQDRLDRERLHTNQPVEGSILKIRRKDGEIRWVRNFAYPVWNSAENRLAGVYGGVQDITSEKLATDQLQALNAELEKRVAERTTKLENSIAELESFSYSISHDLRAPLRAVNGYAGMLLAEHQDDFPPEIIAKLDAIKENGQRMGQLVDGLLQFLRSGKEAIERQEINPTEVIQDVLEKLRPQYEGRSLDIQIDELPVCSANRGLLEKIFEGLINNAIKFTRNREAAQIQIGSLEKDGQTVYFVRDNGVGFDMKYYDKLFGVFQRLHHASEFEGIGASLAIVQRIINRHNGRVWAEAEKDKGATFYFTLD